MLFTKIEGNIWLFHFIAAELQIILLFVSIYDSQ